VEPPKTSDSPDSAGFADLVFSGNYNFINSELHSMT